MGNGGWDERLDKYHAQRLQYFESLGKVEPTVIAPIVSYSLQGFPAWPNREAWRIIHREDSTVLFTDGLSDPYEDDAPLIGIEVAVETRTPLESFNEVVGSWAYQMLFQASFLIAGNPGLRTHYEGTRSATVELYDVPAPQPYVSPRGTVGVLITIGGHLIPSPIPLPEDDAIVFVLTPLLASELEVVCSSRRQEALDKLLRDLPALGLHHYVYDERPAVV